MDRIIKDILTKPLEELKGKTYETGVEELINKKLVVYQPKNNERRVHKFYILNRLDGKKQLITFDRIEREIYEENVLIEITGEKNEISKEQKRKSMTTIQTQNPSECNKMYIYPPFERLITVRDIIAIFWIALFLFFLYNWAEVSFKDTIFYVNTARTINYVKEKISSLVNK